MLETKEMPAKAIIFARVSSKNQADGYSLSAQVCRMQEYCKQNNLDVVKEFRIAESATRGDRKQVYDMIDFIGKQQEPVALICDAVDRLQRSFKEILTLDKLRMSGKIEIHFLREQQVLDKKSNSTQLMAYQLFNLISINCARASSDNAKRGIQRKLQNGECIGKAPIGYLNVRNKSGKTDVIIDVEKASLIKKIFEMYSFGSTSLGDLEKFAKENNLTNNFLSKKEVKPITRNVICRILQNPFYAGLTLVKGVLYKHKYPAIISEELFNQCQEVMKKKGIVTKKYQC